MTSRAAGEGHLDGRVAIVTGGDAGWAPRWRGLAAAGAQVVLAGRQLARCQEVVEKIQGEGGRRRRSPPISASPLTAAG